MKLLKILTIGLMLFSCSTDNAKCEVNKDRINSEADKQIKWVKENSSPIDWRKIGLLNEERAKKLQNACD